jgi:hypothetical protein
LEKKNVFAEKYDEIRRLDGIGFPMKGKLVRANPYSDAAVTESTVL